MDWACPKYTAPEALYHWMIEKIQQFTLSVSYQNMIARGCLTILDIHAEDVNEYF